MAHRISPSFIKIQGNTKQEVLVSTEEPLPVEAKGNISGVYVELRANNQILEGTLPANTMPIPILSNYNPEQMYQTLWLLVYVEPAAPNSRTRVVVEASIADAAPFRVVQTDVPNGTFDIIPIPGGLKNYTIWFGDPNDSNSYVFPTTHWKLLGG